jgi:anionic cell wall polymer biosynthesis LytR-Cps2A-Psr (LCP) family protein
MKVRIAAAAVAAMLALTISGAAIAVSRDPASALMGLSKTSAVIGVPGLLRVLDGTQAVSTGSDGRLTVLLIGSDTRAGGAGLTDTIMVFSVKGNSISAVSIPRDTARIPDPSGGTFPGRINSVLQKVTDGQGTHRGLLAFEHVIENLLQIEIDYYALLRFQGFTELIKEIEPIRVRIGKNIEDPKFWDDPERPKGVFFPQADQYDIYAWQPGAASGLCDGLWQSHGRPVQAADWCHRAIPFVRSRKGPSNSDFSRAHRQQDLVMGAIKRVLERGSGNALGSLVARTQEQSRNLSLATNIPLTMSNALDMFRLLDGASLGFQAVFSPPEYATHIAGGTSYELDLAAVRRVTRQWFGSTGAPPPTPGPTPAPTPTPRPTTTATSTPPVGSTATPGPTTTLSTPSPSLPTSGPTASPLTPPTATPPGGLPTVAPTAALPSGVPTAQPSFPGTTASPSVPGSTATPLIPAGTEPPIGPEASPGASAAIDPPPPLEPGQSPPPVPVPGVDATPVPVGAPGAVASTQPIEPGQPSAQAGYTAAPGVAALPATPGARGNPLVPSGVTAPPATPSSDYSTALVGVLALVLAGGAAAFVWTVRRRSSQPPLN